jgi:RNA polymerase sigma-70 factor, ECF subfamily
MTILDGKALLDHSKAIAYRHLGRMDADTADDLGAEAVLRALRTPAPDGRMQPWLERIFRNLFIDRWRRQRPAPVVAIEDAQLAGGATPEEAILMRERRQAVRARLAQLPRDARRALLSRYYGELDAEATAVRLGIAPTTVRTRIHRSLRRLRDRLGDLRASLPPELSNLLGAKTSALALAPVVVAMLAVAEVRPPAPETATPQPAVATRAPQYRPAQPQVVAQATSSEAVAPAEAKLRPHAMRSNPVASHDEPAPAAVKVIEYGEDDEVVGAILRPDDIVDGAPRRAAQPSLIEVPTDFVAQFEKMVEDRM